MLKLLWSWVFLVLIVSTLMLYHPGLLSSKVIFNIKGSEYDVQLWLLLFIIILLILLVLTLSNFIFSWQRRLIIRRCKKLISGSKALEEFLCVWQNDGHERQLTRAIKMSTIPLDVKNILLKSLLQENDSNGSMFSLWWHGYWQQLAEILLLSEIKSIWKMQICCHLLLAGAITQEFEHMFLNNWQRHAKEMYRLFPTVAYKTQLQVFSFYTIDSELSHAWHELPKKFRRDELMVLAYSKALAKFAAWQNVHVLCLECISKYNHSSLLKWYASNLPADLFDLVQLQKWLKSSPDNKYITFALARYYASNNEWLIVEKLLEKLPLELVRDLKIKLLVNKNDLASLKQLLT